MDRMLFLFRENYQICQSPLMLLNSLTTFGYVRIIHTSTGSKDTCMYTTVVRFVGDKKFSFTDASKTVAAESAAQLAYDYLLSALKTTNLDHLSSGDLDVKTLKAEATLLNKSNGVLNVEVSNKTVTQLLDKLKSKGITVQPRKFTRFDKSTDQLIHTAIMDIPHLGEFKSQSFQSKGQAMKMTVQKVLNHLQTLPSDWLDKRSKQLILRRQVETISEQDVDFLDEIIPSDDEGDDGKTTPSSKSLQSSLMKEFSQLSSNPKHRDFGRMTLVNWFITAYNRSPANPAIIMENLIKEDSSCFVFTTNVKQTPDKRHHFFSTNLTVSRLFSVKSGAYDREESRKKVTLQAYGKLKQFAKLFVHFKLAFSKNLPADELVDALVQGNRKMIQLQTKETSICHHATVTITYGTEFYSVNVDQEAAKKDVCNKVVHFLSLLSERVPAKGLERLHEDQITNELSGKKSPILYSSRESTPVSGSSQSTSSASQFDDFKQMKLIEFSSDEDEPSGPNSAIPEVDSASAEPLKTISLEEAFARRVHFLKCFISVYSPTKSAHEMIRQLQGAAEGDDGQVVDITTASLRDGTFLSKLTLVAIELVLIECAEKPDDSEEAVKKKTVQCLLKLNQLIVDFGSLARHEIPTSIIEKLGASHRQLVQVRTSKNPGIEVTQRQWLTVIRLKYLGSFARTGRNELDSNLAACEDAVAYLAKLANQIDGKQLAAEEKEPSAAAL